ncbi:winged helix domain-containing protein [Paracoccus litorisediminis]|uniref:winged helix domain-containing protein n=1 Tax=Paracoccus litorisediminis TaxID=2006130 RepID=UPI003CCE3549
MKGKAMTFEKQWPARAYTVSDGAQASRVVVKGRDRWALEELMQAGPKGCTPITHPGPRWSAYVFKLRKAGVSIETIHEPHDGPFPGNHARYCLRSSVIPSREAAA